MSGSFDREDLHAPLAEINTTPLVDVLLVLLVIFLVTAPVIQGAIKLKLPSDKSSSKSDNIKTINLSIDASGNYYLNEKLFKKEEIGDHLFRIGQEDKNQAISIRADINVPYGAVSYILSKTAESGLADVRFITQPQEN